VRLKSGESAVADRESDGAGNSEENSEEIDVESPEQWTSPCDELLEGQDTALSQIRHMDDIELAPVIFGDPDNVGEIGKQMAPYTCDIRCEGLVIQQFTGHEINEAALAKEAESEGWYTPGEGVAPHDVGNLLESHGIPVNRYVEANIFNLANELAQGHKVIIGVDSEELTSQNPILHEIKESMGTTNADHTVVVSGVDTTDPDDVKVMVSDPATGDHPHTYEMSQFLHAWEASDFFMVATQDPAPPHLDEMVNFDYDLGHIPYVGDMPYEEFIQLEDHPEQWDLLVDSDEETTAPDDDTVSDDDTPSDDDTDEDDFDPSPEESESDDDGQDQVEYVDPNDSLLHHHHHDPLHDSDDTPDDSQFDQTDTEDDFEWR
jgi:hypothetical protein